MLVGESETWIQISQVSFPHPIHHLSIFIVCLLIWLLAIHPPSIYPPTHRTSSHSQYIAKPQLLLEDMIAATRWIVYSTVKADRVPANTKAASWWTYWRKFTREKRKDFKFQDFKIPSLTLVFVDTKKLILLFQIFSTIHSHSNPK